MIREGGLPLILPGVRTRALTFEYVRIRINGHHYQLLTHVEFKASAATLAIPARADQSLKYEKEGKSSMQGQTKHSENLSFLMI